jgi:glycerol-3-phosphate cytidylyltransferase
MKVATTGTFDLPHLGHAAFLSKAGRLGDKLVVGVLTDSFEESYKGQRPLFDQFERAEQLAYLGLRVEIVHSQREFFLSERPQVIVVGSDWGRKDYLKQIDLTWSELEGLEITLAYVPYTPGISSTEIKRRMTE